MLTGPAVPSGCTGYSPVAMDYEQILSERNDDVEKGLYGEDADEQ